MNLDFRQTIPALVFIACIVVALFFGGAFLLGAWLG